MILKISIENDPSQSSIEKQQDLLLIYRLFGDCQPPKDGKIREGDEMVIRFKLEDVYDHIKQHVLSRLRKYALNAEAVDLMAEIDKSNQKVDG